MFKSLKDKVLEQNERIRSLEKVSHRFVILRVTNLKLNTNDVSLPSRCTVICLAINCA